MPHKHSPATFKDTFTLKQTAAFALAANWADNQKDALRRTEHFATLKRKSVFPQQKSTGQDAAFSHIRELRNYFSHVHSDPVHAKTEAAAFWNDMVLRVLTYLNQRYQDRQDDKRSSGHQEWNTLFSRYHDCPHKLFDFRHFTKPCYQHRNEICFILAPYLSRNQCYLLFSRLNNTDKDSKKKTENQIHYPKDLSELRWEMLRALSQHENIVLRLRDDKQPDQNQEDITTPWLPAELEQGFALWEQLRLQSGLFEGEAQPKPLSYAYLLRQYVMFIESYNVLPHFQFARTEHYEDADTGHFKQRLVYSHAPHLKLRIRRGSIIAQQCGTDRKVVFSHKTLSYVVLAVLHGKTADEIETVITGWLDDNTPMDLTRNPDNREAVQVIQNRIAYLKSRAQGLCNKEMRLQPKIKFIAAAINRAYRVSFERSLSSTHYPEIEDKVRYYRKTELSAYLNSLKPDGANTASVMEVTAIQMGADDHKALKDLLNKDELSDVCADFVHHHIA